MRLIKWGFCILLFLGALSVFLHFNREQLENQFSKSPPIRLLLKQKVKSHVIQARLTGQSWKVSGREVVEITSDSSELPISRRGDHFLLGGLILRQDRVMLKWEVLNESHDPKRSIELVSHDGESFDVVIHQELEPYVAGVVLAEMKSHWPIESLKAQAICARSFAWFHIKRHQSRHYDLWGNSRSQAYSQDIPPHSVLSAVKETEGTVLGYGGKVMMAYYMSTCGGSTREHRLEGAPYHSVECGYCRTSPHYEWEARFPYGTMKKLVSRGVRPDASIIRVDVLTEKSGHASKVHIIPDRGEGYAVDALTFRRHLNKALKKEALKSLLFKIDREGEEWVIKGSGWGYHGRGMCQYGAKGMGAEGMTYLDILRHYYPSFSLVPLP